MSEGEENNEDARVSENGSDDEPIVDDALTEEPEIAEPDYTKANALPFATLCKRFEVLWSQRSVKSNKQSRDKLLEYLLPPKLHEHLNGGSPYPLFRLIMPQLDTARPHSGMKEQKIATTWAEALGFTKGSSPYLKLTNYTDPTIAGTTAAGDLTVALKEVLVERYPYPKSKLTVGQVNLLLDELAGIVPVKPTSHNWRSEGSSKKSGKAGKPLSKKEQQVKWVEKLIQNQLSPNEHKWIARILLRRLEIGVGDITILKYYSPYAEEVHSANNSLKRLCATISDPDWVRWRKQREERENFQMVNGKRQIHMPRCSVQASLGNTIAPMLSQRTSFKKALSDITARHRKYAQLMSEDEVGASSLALQHPAFIAEVKLDGERIVAHIDRGVVTMHTRRSKWYSRLYSPSLGPALRRSIAKYDVDIILDGEVTSWDNGRNETIPFGSNRTVAIARKEYYRRHDMLDDRDLDLHQDEEDLTIMRAGREWKPPSEMDQRQDADHEEGAECWLKYVVFDVLFVGGPDAEKLIAESVSKSKLCSPGSIINLDAMERKKILYRLMEPQENEVVIVPSLVVRPNGHSMNAADYFSPVQPSMDREYQSSTLDSIDLALEGAVENRTVIDQELRAGRTDAEISRRRVAALEHFYDEIVERQCLEGLLFKDLASPYVLGNPSRSLGYWWKLKPDYDESGHASDIDCVIIGANFATGLGRAGLLNQFLVGCPDPDNEGQYISLCNVSGGGLKRDKMDWLLKETGFTSGSNSEAFSYGKWFKEKSHGISLPDFMSSRSYQRSPAGDDDGWKFKKLFYPDLWIHPDDSFVVTLNAGEVVATNIYAAGVTLRFPRITQLREGENKKNPEECDSVEDLHRLYQDRLAQTTTASEEIDFHAGSPVRRRRATDRRFLTVEELNSKISKNGSRRPNTLSVGWKMPTVDEIESEALKGLTFAVLEGTFVFESNSLDAEEAREQGWYDVASAVCSREDVMRFVQLHSGTCQQAYTPDTNFILGGRDDDARVVNFSHAITAASKESRDAAKVGSKLKEILRHDGVLKWTFVYSLIQRWKNMVAENDNMTQDPVLSTHPDFLKSRRSDYLVLSPSAESTLFQTEDVFGLDLRKDVTLVDFKRGLDEARKRKKEEDTYEANRPSKFANNLAKLKSDQSHSVVIPWQHAALTSLDPQDRWIVGGRLQAFWPYDSQDATAEDLEVSQPFVLYPHVYGDNFGTPKAGTVELGLPNQTSDPWVDIVPELRLSDSVASIPLARAMGFQVTRNLDARVTHVLFESDDIESFVWIPDDSSHCRKEISPALRERLTAILKAQAADGNDTPEVTFVTPGWLHQKWDSVCP